MKDGAGRRIRCGKCGSVSLYREYLPGFGEGALACMICGNRQGSKFGFVVGEPEKAARAILPAAEKKTEGGEAMAKVGMCNNCERPEAKMADNSKICFRCLTFATGTRGEERVRRLAEAKAQIGQLKPGERLPMKRKRIAPGVSKAAAVPESAGPLPAESGGDQFSYVEGTVEPVNKAPSPAGLRIPDSFLSKGFELTITFSEKHRYILDAIAREAEQNIREPQQQALYILKCFCDGEDGKVPARGARV